MDIVIFIIACIGNVGLVIWLQGVVQRAMPAPRAPQADWADLRANDYARQK